MPISEPQAAGSRRQASTRRGQEQQGVANSNPFCWLVRAGFLARAIIYGVIAALALALSDGVGVRPASANPQGALALIVTAPLGRVALGVISTALLAYAVWKLIQCARGRGPEGGGGPKVRDRVANLGGGLSYLAFFAVSIAVLSGSAGNGAAQPKRTAAELLGVPGGELLLGIAGIALVGVSVYQAFDAVRGNFANDNKIEQMSLAGWRAFMLIGRVGLLVRAVIFSLIGYFLVRAAIELHAGTAVGVNGALAHVAQAFGAWMLAFLAVGLLTFSAFSLLEARYRRL